MAAKAPKKPTWWKNTFFLFSVILFALAGWGLISGESVIRDPGQSREGGLVWIYLLGSVLMLVNGLVSHQQAVQQYNEGTEED